MKLVPPETQSDAEDHRHVKLMAGGDARRSTGADAAPINNFMRWFQAISANMNAEAQKKALVASRKAASLVFSDVGDDEDSSVVAKAAPAWGDELNTVPRKGNKDLTNSGWPEASQTLGYPYQSTVEANLKADMGINKEMTQRGKM